MQLPVEVAELPEATYFLNYPKVGPPVGKYLGPNAMGEYMTVVDRAVLYDIDKANETTERRGVRVGVAWGIYSVGGAATDPDGYPPEIEYAMAEDRWRREQNEWAATSAPRIIVPRGARIRPLMAADLTVDPGGIIRVTGID